MKVFIAFSFSNQCILEIISDNYITQESVGYVLLVEM